jgi:excisionase family DNA binding protein
MSTNIHIPKNCQFCGKLFTARTTKTRYCSHSCNSKHYKQLKREEKIQESLQITKEQKSLKQVETSQVTTISSKEFLSVSEASELIGVSRWTIQRMIQQGRLKAVPFGRKHIIAKFQIENLFK